jgi:putative tricarboxylic transport membrane protein
MPGDIFQGFLQAMQPSSLVATAIGSTLGILAGMIPGMTISTGIIIVLPLTFVLDPSMSIALLLGLYVGGMMGGSFSAILLNIPGTPSAAATALDGHPLVARGEADRALGISIVASFIGGLFSFLCLFLLAPNLADLALGFRAPDLFSLVFLGLTIICTFAAKSLVKGLLSAVVGLAIISIGQDPVMGTSRFTFGDANLLSGIHFLTALIGLFAIPQLVANIDFGNSSRSTVPPNLSLMGILPRLTDLRRIRKSVGIGSMIGTFLGILPGAGGPIAAFISYDYAKKFSKDPEKFGDGAVEGIAAPESANNAVTGGALVPMMTLGIPGDPVTAILIGALLVHGLVPGPLLFIERADFAYGIIFSFFWANIFNLIVGFVGLRYLVKLIAMPRAILMPTIAILCVVGSYAIRNSVFDVYVMFAFGLLGLGMKRLDIPVVPLLLALVLGRPLEEHLRISLTASQGDLSVFVTSPYSALFLCLSVVSVAWSIVAARRARSQRNAAHESSE